MTIFWHPTGPMIIYRKETLLIDDLNPEAHLTWAISRWEMIKIGIRFILAGVSHE